MSFSVGNKVYVKTPSHGYVLAEITNMKNKDIYIKYKDKFIKETYGTDEVMYASKNISKILPKTNDVRPLFWKEQNRKEFPKWVNETYKIYSSCSERKENKDNSKKFKLSLHQKFVRDYLGFESPYRGLLLYHELGSGKTCASIAVSESLKDKRNIVVLLPARGLHQNFKNQLKVCGDSEYTDDVIKEKYTFLTYKSSTIYKNLVELGNLNNKVIIIDEAHNLANMMVGSLRGGGKQGSLIYKLLLNAKNTKFVCLTGTPLINTPFEMALMLNIIRGLIEVVVFKVDKYTEESIEGFLESLLNDKRIGYVDLERRNRVLMIIMKVNSWDMEFEQTIRYIENKANEYDAKLTFQQTNRYPLFPDDEEEFETYFVKDNNFINRNMFQRRVVGLISYYQTSDEDRKLFPKIISDETIKAKMSNHQFRLYEKAREIEKKMEKGSYRSKKNKNKKQSTIARIFSREFSNFVFPNDIIRPFKKLKILGEQTEKQEIKENKNENKNVLVVPEDITKDIKKAIEDVSDINKNYLSKDGLETLSPKMNEMLKIIEQDKTGIDLVYSSFITIEGLEIFSRVLKRHGFVKYGENMNKNNDYKRYAFFSGKMTDKERNRVIDVLTSSENKEGKLIKVILISAAGAEGLDLKNIRKVLITEPFWHESRIEQVIGRAVRRNSHSELPENERNVKVYRFISVFTDEQKGRSKEKVSTDEYIQDVAFKKKLLNDDFMKIMRDTAIDCSLNQCNNNNCFGIKDKDEGLSYMPNIRENVSYGYIERKKEKEKNIKIVGLTTDNELIYKSGDKYFLLNGDKYNKEPSFVKKFGADIEDKIVYDYDKVLKGELKKVGRFDKYSKFIEDLPE